MQRLPAEQFAARAAIDAALHDLCGKLVGVPVWRLLGLERSGRRPRGRSGSAIPTTWRARPSARRERAVPAAEAEARRPRRPRRRARARGARRSRDVPLQVDVNEYWSLDEALEALPQLHELGVEYCEQPLRRRRSRTGPKLKTALADPDLRRRGLPHARRRRGVRASRARDQHQAREVGRHPRGGADGARRARARPRRDARLHDRVAASASPPARDREPLRPRRPRRQPPARARSVARRRARRRRPAPFGRSPGLASGKRYLVLAEGKSGDPHYGKTARASSATAPTRSSRCSTRSARGRATKGSRSSARVEEALALRADDGARRRRDGRAAAFRRRGASS